MGSPCPHRPGAEVTGPQSYIWFVLLLLFVCFLGAEASSTGLRAVVAHTLLRHLTSPKSSSKTHFNSANTYTVDLLIHFFEAGYVYTAV